MTEALVPGVRAVEALLSHAPERVRRVLYEGDLNGARGRAVEQARALGLPVDQARRGKLDALTDGVRHQGVVSLAKPADYVEWSPLLADPRALLVALDQVTDPRNFGAILRAAEAQGGTGALVTSNRCARLGPTVTRTSAGASELLPVAMETNLARALEEAREAGVQVLGLDMEGTAPRDLDLVRPTVLVVGAEGKGLRQRTRASCDALATIPLPGATESLNAATAAAILVYEAARQRGTGG